MISHKFSHANNPYTPDYHPEQPSKYFLHLDCNNLYGGAMSKQLPISDFWWLNENEIDDLDVVTVPSESEMGYILEVDMKYPTSLHDSHSDYPLAPENVCINSTMLSSYTKRLGEKVKVADSKVNKLTPNLHDKTNYVIHYHNLQQYLRLGMKLTKIHRVLGFTQSAWLKPYISYNTEKRKVATNSFEKDFFKLLNNAIFGKTMENLRNRVDVHLLSEDKIKKYTAKPQFYASKIFDSITAIHLLKTRLTFNRPIYAGFAILEISKTIMYQFHYDYIRQKYPTARLLFTDTDSLCYEITTDDVYADMLHDCEQFDTSDYPLNHPNYSATNKKVLGKFKDETAGKPIIEFVGLKPKMYSILLDKTEKKTAKGISRHVTARD